MNTFRNLFLLTLKWALRDRLLHAILAVALLLFFLVPAFSLFSMRQVQELSITLSLSAISFILLVLATLLGSSSIWRDVEKRYAASVLGLPVSRASYLLAKFLGIAFFIASCATLLCITSCIVIVISSAQYPSDVPIHWQNIILAVAADTLKYILLAAVAVLFSSLSTSFFLPFFATIAIYLAGSATQEVYEYISGDAGRKLSAPVLAFIKGVYYVIPNFAAFNQKVQAIYGLPLSYSGIGYTVLYFLIYTSILLSISVWTFSRRDLP